MPNILIVDDENRRVEFLKKELRGSPEDPYTVKRVSTWVELKRKLSRDYQDLDLVIFDVDFSKVDENQLLRSDPPDDSDAECQGYLMLKALREWESGFWLEHGKQTQFIKVILTSAIVWSISGKEREFDKYMVEAYVVSEVSPADPELVRKILRLCPSREIARIRDWERSDIVCGESRRMYKLMCDAEILAQRDCHVWIDGHTGTGKELIARFIHQRSHRATNLFELLVRLLKELKQLDSLGSGIFGQDVTTLWRKINVDIAKSITRFKRLKLEDGKESKSEIDRLMSVLDSVRWDEDMKQQLLDELSHLFTNKGQRKNVAECMYQVAKLWREDQERSDSAQELFNFVDINCATFPEDKDLLVNLFGVPAGVYTDVRESRPGLIKAASYMYGTLFLDEITELSMRAQAVLLRVLQEGKLRRINSNISEQVDIRVIAATNQDIEGCIGKGEFRPDLFMRIAQGRIGLPPLKDRMEDFDRLAHAFLKRKQEQDLERNKQDKIEFDPQGNVLSLLRTEGWPWDGNIRALQNVVNGAYEMAAIEQSRLIGIDHVRPTLNIYKRLQTRERDEEKEQQKEEVSIDDIRRWLEDAVGHLGIEDCGYDNLQSLIRWLAELFFRRAVDCFAKTGGDFRRPVAGIKRIMGIEGKQLDNNKEIISLKMKDLLNKILAQEYPTENAANHSDSEGVSG